MPSYSRTTGSRRTVQAGVVFRCEWCGADFRVPPSVASMPGRRVRFCTKYCLTRAGRGPQLPPEERFWRAVDRSGGPASCWPWLLSLRDTGYGQIYWDGRPGVKAHRVAFFLEYGYWPKNVLHHCDNPVCCNPAHLYAGSIKQNTQDAIRRRRMLVGEQNGSAKLTAGDIRAILASDEKQTDLAERYGVRVWTISRIKRRITWLHVTRPPAP